MAPASTSPGQLQRAASSEPCTTRPNPFDDNESSSRKRQRTSLSGSPTQPTDVDAAASAPHGLSSAAAADKDPSVKPARQTPESEMASASPQTPEPLSHLDQPTPHTPSSKVTTINLRNSHAHEGAASLHHSSSPRSHAISAEGGNGLLQNTVEGSEPDVPQTASDEMTTPKSSSSVSESPPVEVITIQDDGDDEDEVDRDNLGSANASISIVGRGQTLLDPTEHFPYNEPEETLQETVQRLAHYLSTQTSPDEAALRRIQEWLRIYIGFISHADLPSLLASCRANRSFWLTLPDLMLSLASRKPAILETPMLRDTVLDIYMSFGKLTAAFVNLDYRILQHHQRSPATPNHRLPELYSLGYLQQFGVVTSREELPLDLDLERSSLGSTYEADDVSMLLSVFLAAPGGSLDCINRLTIILIDQIATLPKLAEGLPPVCQMLVNILREFLRIRRSSRHDTSRAAEHLKLGHDLFDRISSALAVMIEKQVTHLSPESTMNQIRTLTDMLRICLHGDHKRSIDTLREHEQNYPDIAAQCIPEAASWSWRFGVLGELIRSSQMQLRMAAVTTMCADLVTLWKSLSVANDDGSKSLLEFLGGYLLQSKLIDYILSPSCHPEIIVESANIVGFLVMTELYTVEHTKRLWQGITSSKDSRIADALTRMVSNITPLFDYRACVGLCEQLQTLPIEAFNPAIRSLCEALLKQMGQQYQNTSLILDLHPYNLCLRILRESSACGSSSSILYPEMQSFALQKLDGLLNHGPDAAGRQELYLNCINDIAAKSSTTLGSLWCLWIAVRHGIGPELQMLTERHDLTRLVVEELEHAIKTGLAANVPIVLFGPPNLPRRELITNIILLQPETLLNELGQKLWNLLVGPQTSSAEDRIAGWQIILDVAGKFASVDNSYLRTCHSHFLPALPPPFFSDGMLDLIRTEVLPLVDQVNEFSLDDEDFITHSGIEQLWRVVFTANDEVIVRKAIHTLAVDIYIDSPSIRSCPLHKARHVHLSLVNRCLRQLQDAAGQLKASSVGVPDAEDELMVIVAAEEQVEEQERVFIRSLQLLRYFLEAHQSKPQFAVPDVRSLMSVVPYQIEGDLAHLTYQSFDGTSQTDVKPLNIGKLNTAASLLASLRHETGFENYRAYYRGRPFLPTEQEICKSLEDLRVHDGLILVKREEDGASPAARIKPGSSPLEIEILTHFNELWDCLSMEENLAKEIYNFLIRLPAHGSIMELFESDNASYQDLFPRGETFKSLYTLHALREYINASRQANDATSKETVSPTNFTTSSYEDALSKSLHFVVQAISDELIFEEQTSNGMRKQLISSFMHIFLQLLQEVRVIDGGSDDLVTPPYSRLLHILSEAAADKDEVGYSTISNSFAAILRLGLLHGDFWKEISADDAFKETMLQLVLFDDRKAIRIAAVNLIEDTVDQESQRALVVSGGASSPGMSSSYPIAGYLWSVISGVLPQAMTEPEQCTELFRILHFLLVRVASTNTELLDLEKLFAQASELLLQHTSTETIDQDEPYDPITDGLSSLSLLCLQMDDALSCSGSLPRDVAQRLFAGYLFPQHRESPSEPVPRVTLNTNTRSKLCEIVFRLIRHDRGKLNLMLNTLNSLVPFYTQEDAADSPYHYDLPCPFDRTKAMRSSSGHVGLKNLSNTCYLNSLLTQLYMNPAFRQFFMSTKLRDPLASQQLLFFTQKLFAYMQESYARFVDPTDLVASIKTPEDTAIDIHNQMDVDEFYSLLFDRWEGQLATNEERKQLRSFYGGQLVQQVKSKECEHISERLDSFSAIQCDIKGKSTLQESLQAYVDGEIMEGDNKYKCSTCDRHVDAVKRACLKDIPDNLIFHLKRIDFSLRTFQRSKINDYFSFPSTIDMQPYTIDHLSGTGQQGKEDIFELVGILVHSGTAESGHYYSYIRERPSYGASPTWVEYNDDIVTQWDPSLMEPSTFGGSDNRTLYDTNGVSYDKSYSAYMLFYQRATSLKRERDAMSTAQLSAPLRVDMDPLLKEAIMTENTMILRRHCLFDPSHATFVQQCFDRAKALEGGEAVARADTETERESTSSQAHSHELKTLAMKVVLGHLDQIISRTKDLPQFDQFAMTVSSAVNHCCDCSLVFYDYFSKRHGAFRALLQRNPESKVRAFAGQTLLMALKKIGSEIPQIYGPESSGTPPPDMEDDGMESGLDRRSDTLRKATSVIEGTVAIFNYLWRFFHASIRSWDEYFGTIVGFAKLGSREVAQLLAHDYLLKTLRIIAADPLLELPANYVRMLHNVLRRLSTRAPSYLAVISLIDHLLQQLEPSLGPGSIVDIPSERLDYPGPTYPWTSDEIMFIFSHPEHLDISFFLEKLLGIDQAREATSRIISRLIGTGAEMDSTVNRTLRKNIRGATSTQAMDPFLRAAAIYLEHTESQSQAQQLMLYVCSQAKHLQNTEGYAFLDFIRAGLRLRRNDEELVELLHDFLVETMPDWAPYLLVYGEAEVRAETEELLHIELFRFPPSTTPGTSAEVDSQLQMVEETVQRLGLACLRYLRDAHVKRRLQLGRDAAASILQTISNCARYYDADTEASEQARNEFEDLHSEVLGALRRLIVDEVEDDGSGWEGSYASSEPMDDFAELTMQAVKEVNGMDTTT